MSNALQGFRRLAVFAVGGFSVGWTVAASLPPLAGDGVTDDTAAIQARLDAGAPLVYLPPPKSCYLISRTLRIGSDTELRLDRFTVVRLAPKSDCPMVENRSYRAGRDVRLALTGGVWDMACAGQSPNAMAWWWYRPQREDKVPKTHDPDHFWGMAMRFSNVEDITVKGVTIRNPTTYGMAFCRMSRFLIDDITFDYRESNPYPGNQDGVHLDGNCHHGRISNLRGTCFDDMVALNANDGACAQEEGPITDVAIDGLFAGYCHSAVRLLSAPAEVRRVTIRNVFGEFFVYAVGLTHYFPERPRGTFDDIVIEDVFMTKAFAPESFGRLSRVDYNPLFIEGPVDVGTLTVSRFVREERNLPTATLFVDPKATVRNLVVRDAKLRNRLKESVRFFDVQGRVDRLTVDNLDLGENCVRGNEKGQ